MNNAENIQYFYVDKNIGLVCSCGCSEIIKDPEEEKLFINNSPFKKNGKYLIHEPYKCKGCGSKTLRLKDF